MSTLRDTMIDVGDIMTRSGVFSALEGYCKYIAGCPVHSR